MTLLTALIQNLAADFDDKKYPSDVYLHLLEEVRTANTRLQLGEALAQALAWKDGKIRRDPAGPHSVSTSGTRYRAEQTRPNTFCERHRQVLCSEEFFTWAARIRAMQHFDVAVIRDLERKFQLWSETAVVIPVFLLHCLRPQVFPIVDRWVLLAYNLLEANPNVSPEARLQASIEEYAGYQSWWLRLLAEAGLGPLSAQINQLKVIDEGLWVFGKRAAAFAKDVATASNGVEESVSQHAPSMLGTDSKEFRQRAIAIRNSGKTQSQAIKDAAAELGIELKPSYSKYPGSHFERWRKQGFE